MTTFITEAAKPLFKQSLNRDHAPPHELEDYYGTNEGNEECIYCTTTEREEAEDALELAFTADVIEDENDYAAFVRYLAENCGLQRMD